MITDNTADLITDNMMIRTSLSYQLAPAKIDVAESMGVSSSVYVFTFILALYRSDNNIYTSWK